MKRTEKIEIRLTKLEKEKFLEMQLNLGYSNLSEMVRHLILNKGGIKMTKEMNKELRELLQVVAEGNNDLWNETIEAAKRDLEDGLRMNSIWAKYRGTDEEYAVMQFFVNEYNKELERLYKEA